MPSRDQVLCPPLSLKSLPERPGSSGSTKQVSTGLGVNLEAKVRRRGAWNVDMEGNQWLQKVQVDQPESSVCRATAVSPHEFTPCPGGLWAGALAVPFSSVGAQHPSGFWQKWGAHASRGPNIPELGTGSSSWRRGRRLGSSQGDGSRGLSHLPRRPRDCSILPNLSSRGHSPVQGS